MDINTGWQETPYPLGEDGDWKGLPPYRERWENPCVHVSKDGIHWNDFEDSQNPIDDLDENNIINKDYFSDPHLVFYKDTLECWYRISHQKIMLLIYYANILSMEKTGLPER